MLTTPRPHSGEIFCSIKPWFFGSGISNLMFFRLEDPRVLLPMMVDDAWDWERLVRQLAQTEIFESGNLTESAPLGLRNRRQIWRLVGEARRLDSESVIMERRSH